MLKLSNLFAILAICAPAAAFADEPGRFSYAWREPGLASEYGVSTILGGGITGFTDKTMRDATTSNVGGLWDLRVTLGSHTPIGLDLAYVGTAASLDALDQSQSGTLVGTSVEGCVRYNVLPHYAWNPYAFAGIGWQRYDVTGAAFTTTATGMNDSDNAIVLPMGIGVAYRDKSGLVVDLRGTFRADTNSQLVLEEMASPNYVPMHTWEASGAIGYEF